MTRRRGGCVRGRGAGGRGATLSFAADEGREAAFGEERFALAFARIECHYFVNGGFFEEEGWLLNEAGRLADVPGAIVQGTV